MKKESAAASTRSPIEISLEADLAVIGGGMAGTCCAITAARQGIKVVLVQDRPVLGGNASSEVRLWILGATSHMGNNNRWAREGGVLDEILVENIYRNSDGNTLILDTILLEKVLQEQNITLLLNTAVFNTEKSSSSRISGVTAFCSQNSTIYNITAPLFCDASGDGIVGFQSGAAFRIGAESADEFNEPFAPTQEYGELLGHSMYFMTKDVGKSVEFVAPDYALKDITKIPHYKRFNVEEHGCWLWWIEYGGRLDTVHDTENIKWELWKVVYGVWDYIKNSGKFPEAKNMTLEWVGQIPGKRESRRFEGLYMMRQSDIVEQKVFEDAVAHGGWAIDLHPADGVFSEKPSCNQWHSKGVYEIPYRSMVSKNIENLFLAGRIFSASHVAFGSTRVMATLGHAAQAVGIAAVLATEKECKPADLLRPDNLRELQQELLKSGQHIPHKKLILDSDLNAAASIRTNSELILSEIPGDGDWMPLEYSSAQLLPLEAGPVPIFEVSLLSEENSELTVSLRRSSKPSNYTPEVLIAEQTIPLVTGEQNITLDFQVQLDTECYYFLCFHQNRNVSIRSSQRRITGLVSVFNKENKEVSNFGRQDPDPSLGFESFEFWVPIRRPDGHNFAMSIDPPLSCFGSSNLTNGYSRPYLGPNAWVADLNDDEAEISLEWKENKIIEGITLIFDTDWDHPMESSLFGHPERVMPFTVQDYQVFDQSGNLLQEVTDNHQTRNRIEFESPINTNKIVLRFKRPSAYIPIALYGIEIHS